MSNTDWAKTKETMLDRRASGYYRSKAFAAFLEDDKHLFYLDTIETLLEDENPSLRCEVVRRLRDKSRSEYDGLFGFALPDSDDYVVREALRGLSNCHNPRIIAAIETLMETAPMSTRFEAERTLAKIRESMPAEVSEEIELDGEDTEGTMRCKTEEVVLSMDVLPKTAPIPIKRHLNRYERQSSMLNASEVDVPEATAIETHEGVVATIVGLAAVGLLLLFLA